MEIALRQRMLETPLGNGALYAREFEQACEQALIARRDGTEPSLPSDHPVLNENELVRRAALVKDLGQLDSALRIVEYTLRHYPTSVGALLVKSGLLELGGQLQSARDLLQAAVDEMQESDDQRGIEVNLARLDLLLGQYKQVTQRTASLLAAPMDDMGRLHIRLYAEAAHCWARPINGGAEPPAFSADLPFVSVLVHCNDDERFANLEANLGTVLAPGCYECLRVRGESRADAYAAAIGEIKGDMLLFVRSGTRILSPTFHADLTSGLKRFDIVGYAGADLVAGPRWFDAGFPHAHGAVVLPNGGPVGGLNLSVYGPLREEWITELRILDEGLFAARRSAFDRVTFDSAFEGDHGLCESDWFIRAADVGLSLGACARLGVARLDFPEYGGRGWYDGSALFRERHSLDDISHSSPVAGASVLLPTLEHALPLINHYFAGSTELRRIPAEN